MHRWRGRIALAGATALALVALVWVAAEDVGSAEGRRRAGGGASAAEVERAALVGLDGRPGDAADPPADPALPSDVIEQAGRRESEAFAEPDTAPARPVMGVVSDARGGPLPGVEVEIAAPGGSAGEYANRARIERRTTGPDGGFVFEGADTRVSGVLTYGGGLLLRGELVARIDPDATYQILTVPDPELEPVTWSIRVEDEAGEPLAPEVVDLRFGGGDTGDHARAPLPADRVIRYGSIEQRVAPGRWIIEVASPESLVELLEVVIPRDASGGSFRSVVVLERIGLADAVDLADAGGRPWLDPGQGLDGWLPPPEERLAIGENRRDRYFAATFRTPGGAVRAAELYLDIEANSGASSNDSIYLDSNARKEHAWANRISSLTGGRWQSGMRRRFRVDLSALPAASGGTVDLRPALEDGRLTVVIQDDTVVHAARLRVIQ